MSKPSGPNTPSTETAEGILPHNPPGTYAPGTFAPGSIAPGVVHTIAPSYPLPPASPPPQMQPADSYAPVQQVMVAMQPQQPMYMPQQPQVLGAYPPQVAYPQQAVVADPRVSSPPIDGKHQLNGAPPQAYYPQGVVMLAPQSPTGQMGYHTLPPGAQMQAYPQGAQMQAYPQGVQMQTIPMQPQGMVMAQDPNQQAIPMQATGQPYMVALAPQPMGLHPQQPTWSTSQATLNNGAAQSRISYVPPGDVGYVEPPSYTPSKQPEDYAAEVPPLPITPTWKYTSNGTMKTVEPLLSTNADACYRFIIDNLDLPTYRLHCYGSHTVTDIKVRSNKVETKEKVIVDFDFIIDLSLSMQRGSAELYVLADDVSAYRGTMDKETSPSDEKKDTVRDWITDFAESPKTMKKLRFRKFVYGLDYGKTIDAVNQIINSTGHTTHKSVWFSLTNSTIKVNSPSTLMAILANGFLKFLLWIILVYPFLWLYYRYSSQSGKWDVCRAHYSCTRDPRDPPGSVGCVPLGDGDWVKVWERTIRLGVGNRIQSNRPIYRPTPNDSGVINFD